MADKNLSGKLILSRIDKSLVQTDDKGNKFIYVDVVERQSPSQYGATHYISTYDKATGKKTYLADLKPRVWNGDGTAAQPAAAAPAEKPLEMGGVSKLLQPEPAPVDDGDMPF